MKASVRQARPDDSQKVAQVHFAAVRQTGAKFYSKEICEEWSPSF